MFGASDPVDWTPRRVLVAGVSGVGKTTLASAISSILGVPHTEIDALFHGPDWVPRESFLRDVETLTSKDAWVTEWQYTQVRPLLARRADTLVWLDLPVRVALWRLITRTLRRSRSGVELWNGNVEPPLRRIFVDRDHIIRWGVRTRRKLKPVVPRLESEYPGLRVVRLRSQRDVEVWLATLADAVSGTRSGDDRARRI
jgi:adenylate kinase family enzyme